MGKRLYPQGCQKQQTDHPPTHHRKQNPTIPTQSHPLHSPTLASRNPPSLKILRMILLSAPIPASVSPFQHHVSNPSTSPQNPTVSATS
ncbi:hypothetical protein BC829DRAFT_388468 [Chytridium lagenaria]|nr:hypothetical protein BC829DRAFT_388468 [Chytridium lagenaria]